MFTAGTIWILTHHAAGEEERTPARCPTSHPTFLVARVPPTKVDYSKNRVPTYSKLSTGGPSTGEE